MINFGNFDKKGKICDVYGIKLIPALNYYRCKTESIY